MERKSTDAGAKEKNTSPDSVVVLRANLERKAIEASEKSQGNDGSASVANILASFERKAGGAANEKGDVAKIRDTLETKSGGQKKTTPKNKDVIDVCNANTFATLRAKIEEKAKITEKKGPKEIKAATEEPVTQVCKSEVFLSLCTNMEQKSTGKGRKTPYEKNKATIQDITEVCKPDSFATLRADMEEKANTNDKKSPKESKNKVGEVSEVSKIDSLPSQNVDNEEKTKPCENNGCPESNTEVIHEDKSEVCKSDSFSTLRASIDEIAKNKGKKNLLLNSKVSTEEVSEVCNAEIFAKLRANMESKSASNGKDESRPKSPKDVSEVCDADSFSNLRANMEEKSSTGSAVIVDLSDFIKQQNEGKRIDKAKKGEASYLLHSYHGKAALVGTIFDPELILNQDKGGSDSDLHAAANRAAAAAFLSYGSTLTNTENNAQNQESMEELATEDDLGDSRSFSSAKVCTFMVHVDHGFIINPNNITHDWNKDNCSYTYGGDIELNEFLAAVRACSADKRTRLLTAAKLAAGRHIFEQNGIDIRKDIERLRPCEIQSDNKVNGLNCELKGVLYFCLFVRDEDFPKNVSISNYINSESAIKID